MNGKIQAVPLQNVDIRDDFWSTRQRLMTDVTIPFMEKILRDQVPGAEKSHAVSNFRIAAGEEKGKHFGMVFQDSDVYKWIEAAAYSLRLKPDAELESRLDEMCRTVKKAQLQDGYVNTYFTLEEPRNRWKNLLECHELYCAGHLLEAACACCEALGKKELLSVAEKLADHIISQFWEGNAVPGHQEIEIGLLRLYHVTGKTDYLHMAEKFLDRRGQKPDYFELNTPAHPGVHYGGYDIDVRDHFYNQTYAPVRQQHKAEGHAVRCLYMLTAMADAAAVNGDEGLKKACCAMFENIVERRMYVTGGVGACAYHESFGQDYELPNDRGYNETCASVAMAFFMRKMLCLSPDGQYADILERELYNGALSGMQLDGSRFFYVNPLEATPGVSGEKEGLKHVLVRRPNWYSCACCPPNLARLIASLGQYLWSESEDTVYSHLWIGNDAKTRLMEVTLESEYPWKGKTAYTVHNAADRPITLAIHIPFYIEEYELRINGEKASGKVKKGYLYLNRLWKKGDRVEILSELAPRRIYSDPRVKNNRDRVAVARGPVIYCLEGCDQEYPLAELALPEKSEIRPLPYDPSLLSGVVPLSAAGVHRETGKETRLSLIPYYAWSNRQECEMRVWIHEKTK